MKKRNHKLFGFMKFMQKIHKRSSTMFLYQKDNRIPQKEKNILESWQLLRINKFDEIIQKLAIPIQEDDLAEAQRLLVLGITYNNKTDFNLSMEHLEKSIQILKQYNEESTLFTAYYNLFITYINAKSDTGIKRTISILEDFPLESKMRNLLFHQCLFNFHSYYNNHEQARDVFIKLDKLRDQMTDSMLVTHLQSGFTFYVKTGNYNQCKKILHELKDKKGFCTGAQFKLMKYLLFNLIEDEPIYAYKEDFEAFPYIYQQLMTIHHLEAGQINSANEFWRKLQAKYPETHLDDFDYRGDVNLFSLCLDKYRPRLTRNNFDFNQLTKDEAIFYVLSNTNQWLSKEELYQHVWGKKLEEKKDLNRLQKYITILRNRGVEIIYKKSAYKLESQHLKKSS